MIKRKDAKKKRLANEILPFRSDEQTCDYKLQAHSDEKINLS